MSFNQQGQAKKASTIKYKIVDKHKTCNICQKKQQYHLYSHACIECEWAYETSNWLLQDDYPRNKEGQRVYLEFVNGEFIE